MKAINQQALTCVLGALALTVTKGALAVAVVTLPDPGAFIQGIPTNQVYDQGLVYSAKLLDQMQSNGQIPASYGNYQFSTGTGNIPVLVYTGANGATNDTPFQNPLSACGGGNCTNFDGTWGLGASTGQFAGTVGAMRSALDGSNMMFYFDHNEQEGNNATPNLQASGQLMNSTGLT